MGAMSVNEIRALVREDRVPKSVLLDPALFVL